MAITEKFHINNNKPYCNECFIKLFTNKCYACGEPITDVFNLLTISQINLLNYRYIKYYTYIFLEMFESNGKTLARRPFRL